MKTALAAPLFEAVPPLKYGGTERIVAYPADALVDLGHEVTLFASGDSRTKAELHEIAPHAIWRDPSLRDHLAPQNLLMEVLAKRAEDFDIVHVHNAYVGVSVMRRLKVPYLVTLHNAFEASAEVRNTLSLFSDAPYVSISRSQREGLPVMNYVSTVHHGIPENLYSLGEGRGNYLVFLGRMAPEKGPETAIRIAERAGATLKIAARADAFEQSYLKKIHPELEKPHVHWLGEINDEQKATLLGNATALLFPVVWPEPFGLVMVEAMACGTPTIAFDAGSILEVIDEGLTGWVVKDEDEAVHAVGKAKLLDRATIRRHGLQRFNARRMALDYLSLYEQQQRPRM